MAILVCEGRCSNGTVQAYDHLVRQATTPDAKPAMTHEMRGLRKQFVYTEHWGNGSGDKLQTCGVCGCVRRFGEPLL